VMKKVLFASGAAGGDGIPVRNGLVAEYKFDECRNLLKYSQQFDNAAWTKTRSTVTANATAAPDGTTTADKFVEDATAANNHAINVTTVTVAGTVTYSIYAKAGERTRFRLNLYESGNSADAYFDLSNGTVDNVTAGGTATITPVGDSWYRCALTSTFNASSTLYLYLVTTGTTVSYNGDGTSGIYLWGAQLEVGSAATTYVPTTDKQTLMDYSKPRKNLLLPNQANCCEDGTTTGFATFNGSNTLTADATEHWQGAYSLKVVTANAITGEGFSSAGYATIVEPNAPLTLSFYIKGSGTVKGWFAQRTDADGSVANTLGSEITLTGDWTRYSVSTAATAPTTRRIYLVIYTTSKQAATFYVDGIQVEQNSTATAWEAPPNIGIVGSAIGTTTNDPTWTGEGAKFETDDFISISGFSDSPPIKTIIFPFYTPNQISKNTIGSTLLSGVALGWSFSFGSVSGLIDNEIITINHGGGHKTYWADASATIAPGWHVLVITSNNSAYQIYLDGVSLPVSTLTAFAQIAIAKYAIIGKRDNGAGDMYLNATLPYIVIYNRALTQAEIAKNYAYLKSYLKKQRGITLA
jgi:hypothetical protein